MSWLIDAHVHYQTCFGWERFLAGAFDNLDRAAKSRPEENVQAGCLLFVDVAGRSSLEQLGRLWTDERLATAVPGHEALVLHATDEPNALCLQRPQGPPLLLMCGRQIATEEGLEVLAIGCATALPDGRELEETIRATLEADAIPILPWGFGKWWFARGRRVRRLLDGELAPHIYLGDNGNRAALAPEPPLFALARQRGIPVLPGSDPLPLAHHARRALSYGFRLAGKLDLQRPLTGLRERLQDRPTGLPVFGHRCGLPRFASDQLRMQIRVRRRSQIAPSEGSKSRIEVR